ncbi:MAG: hypothetical protein WA159_16715, partial [Variovorax sp.]
MLETTAMPTTAAAGVGAPRYRPLAFGITRGVLREGEGGVQYLQADQPLGAYAHRMTERLVHW